MYLGEVCLQTNDVIKMASFYRALLDIREDCDDPVHQTLVKEEPQFAIYKDGTDHSGGCTRITIAFTTDDADAAYERVVRQGAKIIEPPVTRPWGARNFSFYDPDGNTVYVRQIL